MQLALEAAMVVLPGKGVNTQRQSDSRKSVCRIVSVISLELRSCWTGSVLGMTRPPELTPV